MSTPRTPFSSGPVLPFLRLIIGSLTLVAYCASHRPHMKPSEMLLLLLLFFWRLLLRFHTISQRMCICYFYECVSVCVCVSFVLSKG